MPAYHSRFLETECQSIGNFATLPFRQTKDAQLMTSHVDPDSPDYDILDDILDSFRANIMFRNFKIDGNADCTLIYGILWISECLRMLQPEKPQDPLPTLNQALVKLRSSAHENIVLPGDAKFPLNQYFQSPGSAADQLRTYITQMRMELAGRLVARLYADGTGKPSKWWLAFSKRKFMSVSLSAF